MKRHLLAILVAGAWMNISEFIRNELLLKNIWVDGFSQRGLSFPTAPINGAVWGLWAFIFVSILSVVVTKFNVLKSALISWIFGFVLLWLAIWNMGIMPAGLLYWAVPWSFIEVYVAALICNRMLMNQSA